MSSPICSPEGNKPKIKIRLKTTSKINLTLKKQRDPELKPFWNQTTEQLSHLFWSPYENNCTIGLRSKIPLRSWVSNMVQKRIN